MQPNTALRRMESLPKLSCAGKPINGLYRLLTYRPLWSGALLRIRGNKGAGTPGIDGKTVLELSDEDIEMVIQSLMDGTYRPKPVKRVHIPKANGNTRPLGIPTALDRLVQEVVRCLLNEVYEPIFSDRSHGFRAERSCHTALESIQLWHGVKWLVEVDVKGFFDNIDHGVLLNLLRKRITDQRFLDLISKMLKAGFLEQWVYNKTYSGTPQGGIISPLLANVYLHELDLRMEEMVNAFNKGKSRRRTPEYNRLNGRSMRAKAMAEKCRASGQADLAKSYYAKHEAIHQEMLRVQPSDPFDLGYRRLVYVRYADDFLIGVIGPKAEADRILHKVTNFLVNELHLETSPEKSGVLAAKDGVEFLGYDVTTHTNRSYLRTVRREGTVFTRRTMVDRVQLSVPKRKIEAFARNRGYGNLQTLEATHRSHLITLDEVEIVRAYNAELRGFANYYAMAWDVKRKLNRLEYLWKKSLSHTLAGKHRTTTKRMADRMRTSVGHYVGQTRQGDTVVTASLWRLADLKKVSSPFAKVDEYPNLVRLTKASTSLAARIAAVKCSECGDREGPLHVHHINPMRTLGKDAPWWKQRASQRSRKTRVLCATCHRNLHAGIASVRAGTNLEGESRVH